jgi:hypothetical protein
LIKIQGATGASLRPIGRIIVRSSLKTEVEIDTRQGERTSIGENTRKKKVISTQKNKLRRKKEELGLRGGIFRD